MVPDADDVLVLIFLEQASVLEAADGVFDDGVGVDRLAVAGAGFAQERVEGGIALGVVGRRHEGGVVGEIGDAVEGAVVFGEVHPALGGGARALDADADHVAAAVEQARGFCSKPVGDIACE
jgi:hypothetical protein